ncbi:cation:proton antiporter domain-containing protein [Rummeliibacillus sp. JY-2-4R]
MIVGVLLGPSLLGLISGTDSLSTIRTIGVILLMFLSGLETNLEEFKGSRRSSTFIGLSGISVPLFLGYFTGIIIDLTNLQSWLGIIFITGRNSWTRNCVFFR